MITSIPYMQLHDQMVAITDSLWAERDPIKRLALADALERDGMAILRKIKYESAYTARTKYSAENISRISGIDRKQITYLVKKHMDQNPQLPRITKKANQDVSDFIDLRHLLAKEKETHLQSKSPTGPSSTEGYTQDHDLDEPTNHSL
jgi:hypothetical protein